MLKLKMSNISKSFSGNEVLHNVSLTVDKGSIHALIGENGAGKSTLMNILGGVYSLEKGIISLDGVDYKEMSIKKAEALGIAFVHQEINLFNDLLVYENIFIGNEIKKFGFIDKKAMIKKTSDLFTQIGVDISPTELVGNLSTGKKQLLAIAKALFTNATLFILDEPTTALSNEEIDNLFKIIRSLRDKGNSFIFISHKMPEIFALCDSYTVFRNGNFIATGKIKDTTPAIITSQIVGEKHGEAVVYKERELGETVLELNKCSGKGFNDISFTVRKGEIIGFTGLQGSGTTELLEAMFGIEKFSSGEVIVKGRDISNMSTKMIMRQGVGMIPSNRKENSVFPNQDMLDNLYLANFQVDKSPFYNKKEAVKDYEKYKKELSIKVLDHRDLLLSLSGGNQQKIILARWLKTNADILLLDNPTQGIDVGAKDEIYKLLLELAKGGKTIIFNTLEIPEIQKCADRCFVFYHGHIEKILKHDEIIESDVMMYATNANKTEVKK